MTQDLTTLDGTRGRLWRMLEAAPNDPASPARTVALATRASHGGGTARMIVLRGADRENETLTFFTNRASAKVQELNACPTAEVLVWDPTTQFQARLRVSVALSDGPADVWNRFGDGARSNYAGTPLPGSVIAAPGEVSPVPDPAVFVVMTARVTGIETLWLAPDLHRRARFTGREATWIAP